jgi:hypothetical protein
MRVEFKRLLEESGFITPGKPLDDVRVLLLGRDCFEALAPADAQEIYNLHQREIIERAKMNFQVGYTFISFPGFSLRVQDRIARTLDSVFFLKEV